jgi:peptide/nickel transport system permease protein
MIPTLFLVTVIIFASVRLIPGKALDLMVSEMASESTMGRELTIEYLRHQMGMDVPIHVQYARWVGKVFRGDLGTSLWTRRVIVDDITTRIPVTFELGVIALATALLIALPLGVYSAVRQDTSGDYVGRTIAVLCISVPSFWLGTMIMVYPSLWFGWSPPIEYIRLADDPIRNIAQFVLPGFIMGMALSGTTMRMTRTMMLEVLRQDYIRTAWSKGLAERTVVLRHAFKNAFIPIVSMIGLLLPVLIGGSVVMEQIFSLPGMGVYLLDAISKRDYPVISAVNVVLAGFVLVVNLFVDLSYGWLDPRIHYQ